MPLPPIAEELLDILRSHVPGVDRLLNSAYRERQFGNLEGAADFYRQAIPLLQQAVESGEAGERTHLASAQCNLASVLLHHNAQDSEGLALYEEGLAHYEELGELREVTRGRHRLFQMRGVRGDTNLRMALIEPTLEAYEAALAKDPQYAEAAMFGVMDLAMVAGFAADEKRLDVAHTFLRRALDFSQRHELDAKGKMVRLEVLKTQFQLAVQNGPEDDVEQAVNRLLEELHILCADEELAFPPDYERGARASVLKLCRESGFQEAADRIQVRFAE